MNKQMAADACPFCIFYILFYELDYVLLDMYIFMFYSIRLCSGLFSSILSCSILFSSIILDYILSRYIIFQYHIKNWHMAHYTIITNKAQTV